MVTSILDHYSKLQEVAEAAARQFREAKLAEHAQTLPEAVYPSPLPLSNVRHATATPKRP